jgi:hypothetical protein
MAVGEVRDERSCQTAVQDVKGRGPDGEEEK